jgi:hypothetical protein
MKRFQNYFLFGVLSTSALLSCKNEDTELNDVITPVVVQFSETQIVLNENETGKTVAVSLSRAASADGSIEVEFTSDKLSGIKIEPAAVDGILALPVAKGSTSASFTIQPINNTIMDGAKTISVSLKKVTDGFQLGANKSVSLSVVDDEAPVAANFLFQIGTTRENVGSGAIVTIALSNPAPAEGHIEITFSSINQQYGTHFVTEPAAIDGKVLLPVQLGSDHVSFKVIPTNDLLFNGERTISFSLNKAQGGVSKGAGVTHALTITDDELAAKPKGYQIAGGGWSYNRRYEYNENGDLAKIIWEQYTPGFTGGTYSYEYQAGRLHKMVENANRETFYLWEQNRIVKTEQYTNGELTQYTMYGYDQAGNVGERAVHYRQPNGELKLGLVFVYLYFTDGNLYKKMVYNPLDGNEEYALVATHTYDNYLDNENPFPAEEILPNWNSQPNLPGTYRVETNGQDILYQFSYTFSNDGKPLSRTATSTSGSETATYQYY